MTRTLSLRGRFAVWTSLVVSASILALLLAVHLLSFRILKAQADEEMDRIVSKTADELDLWISSRERDAVNLSELKPFADACADHRSADAEQALVRIHRRSPFYENVFLADAQGKLFLDSIGGRSVGIEIMSIAGYRPNVEHAQKGEVWVGGAMRSPATGRPVVLITAPIVVGNQVAGILGTPIELANFSDSFVNKFKIHGTGYLYMFDATGTVLAHPDSEKILRFNVATTDFGRKMLERSGGSETYDFEGTSQAAHFQRAHEKPWTIAAVVPTAELVAGIRTMQTYLLIFGAIALAATLVAVSYLAGRTSRSVSDAASELQTAVRQFFATSSQIAANSQTLSQGASEQAASIEETSASAEEINSITRQNADRSEKVAELMNRAMPIISEVNASHRGLAKALIEMSASNEKVANVIKMIDGIAFQTNILALNAAVEAARAGEAGMGFAVVADEVRNLAQRSASAARDTTTLIEEALLRSQESRQRLDGVLKAMEANNAITAAIKVETDGIQTASEEQARGMTQISTGISQMSQVTQTTAAQAEENAAASEELDAQASALADLAARLSAMASGAGSASEARARS